jgi:hypothetical protein
MMGRNQIQLLISSAQRSLLLPLSSSDRNRMGGMAWGHPHRLLHPVLVVLLVSGEMEVGEQGAEAWDEGPGWALEVVPSSLPPVL